MTDNYFIQFLRLGSSELRCWQVQFLIRPVSRFADGHLLTVSSRGGEREKERDRVCVCVCVFWSLSFIRTLIPSLILHPNLITFQRPNLEITITLWMRASKYEF